MIISLDIGTTGIRAISYNHSLTPQHSHYLPISQSYPHPSWVEQDPEEIKNTCLTVIKKVIAQHPNEKIEALTITNQRESTLAWDAKTGTPIHPVISWQCRRTANRCAKLTAAEQGAIKSKTGLIADAYFSATKLEWLFNKYPDARDKAAKGELLFGTLDSYIIWVLSEGKAHVTDVSNASRTMLFNIHTLSYDETLLDLFNIPNACLPKVKESQRHFANIPATIFGQEIPIMAVLGDQQAGLFAQCGEKTDEIKNTYGTGLFAMASTGSEVLDKPGIVSTIAWQREGKTSYAVEGSVFTGGSLIQWLRDDLELIQNAADTDHLAKSVAPEDMENLFLVPALNGLGCPHWDSTARGLLIGLTRAHKKAHIARAALEALTLQTWDVIEKIGQPFSALKVDGGATANEFLMQAQADILGIPVEKNQIQDATALGVAAMAAIGMGFISEGEFRAGTQIEKTFTPNMTDAQRTSKTQGWQAAIDRSKNWVSS